VEWDFHAAYPLLGALSGGQLPKIRKSFSPSSGKNCDIDFPGKWKVFSTRTGRLVPDTGQFMGNHLGLSRSTFGIPIAMEGVTD
jgi:hypothetical protein